MAIILTKTDMPTSSNYYTASGTGSETITISGTDNLTIHTKKDLIKVQKRKTKSRQASINTDEFDNQVVDLKKGTDELIIRGYLEDETGETAWNKFWILRAMCSRGGSLTSVVIDNITFSSATQEAFLESITGIVNPKDNGRMDVNHADDRVRMDVSISLFIGDER